MFAARVLIADTLIMFYLQYCTEYGMHWPHISSLIVNTGNNVNTGNITAMYS